MGRVLHGGATTAAAIRRAIQRRQDSLSARLTMLLRWSSGAAFLRSGAHGH